MAKKMHPDKNGGTEAAKLKFEQMKERYESLKKKRGGDGHGDETVPRNAGDSPVGRREDSRGHSAEGEDCSADPCLHGSSDHAERPSEDVGSDTQQDAGTSNQQSKEGRTPEGGARAIRPELDPHDRESMVEAVAKMAGQLKQFADQDTLLAKQLEQALAQVPPEISETVTAEFRAKEQCCFAA